MTRRPADGLADAHLAPLVSRGEVPSLAWAVVRDEDIAAGGFGGCGAGDHLPGRLGDQGLHRAAAGGYGRTRRGSPIRSGRELPSGPAPLGTGAGRQPGLVTLADLATHTSGLPRLPRGPVPLRAAAPRRSLRPLPGCPTGARRAPCRACRFAGESLRLLQLRLRPARLPARPGRGDTLRDPGDDADLRPARPVRHDVRGTRPAPRGPGPPTRAPGPTGAWAPWPARAASLDRGRSGPFPASLPDRRPGALDAGDPRHVHPAPGRSPAARSAWPGTTPAGATARSPGTTA